MKNTIIVFILISFIPSLTLGVSQVEEREIIFYGKNFFLLEGSGFGEDIKESIFHRLPKKSKTDISELLWDLSKCPAGMSIRFITNSTAIHLKWVVLDSPIANRNHMASTGVKGIDLYFKNDDNWQYVNTARPNGKEFQELLVDNMDGKWREFRMYLPLYIELTDLKIGITSNSQIKRACQSDSKPIVFYGTSITQGGCASRPGMAYTNIISRKLNIECVNFGFRGNGQMDPEIGNILKQVEARFYVIDCLPNMSASQIKERTRALVEIIRKEQRTVPIVFVENLMYEKGSLDILTRNTIIEKNKTLRIEYEKMIKEGIQAVFYISGENALGTDHEATVDGIHFTDLGFLRYADFLIQNFRNYNLL